MNILIIGLGSIARKHIISINKVIQGAVIFALRSSENSEYVPGVHNINSLKELPGKPGFVIISNPTQLHEEAILKSIVLDCPLFIEKPVLKDIINANSIIAEINRRQIITYVACNMRFHPVIQFLKTYIADNSLRINEVNIYCGSYLPDWRPEQDFRESYSSKAGMGGGVHLDLIHELDYCMWLFGKTPDIRSYKRNVSTLSIDSVDCAYFHLFYPDFTANISINYFRKDSKREIEILTPEDTIVADLLQCKVFEKMSGEILYQDTFNIQETYTAQLNYFIENIHLNRQPMNDFCEGVETLKIALHE